MVWIPIPFWMVMIFFEGAYGSDRQWMIENNEPQSLHGGVLGHHHHEQQYEAAMEGFYEGYSADSHLMGCDSFVSAVLVVGPEAALQAHDWILSRGCPNSPQQTVHAIAGQAGTMDKIDRTWNLCLLSDRAEVVRLLSDWKVGMTRLFL